MAKFEVGKTYSRANQTVKVVDITEKSVKIEFNDRKVFRRKIQRLNEGFDNEMQWFCIDNCDPYPIRACDRID